MLDAAAPSGLEPLTQRLDEMLQELQEQRRQLDRLTRAYAVDAEQIDRMRSLSSNWDPRGIASHIREAIASTTVLTDPFPHMVIEPLLPESAFRTLLDAVPPDDFFEGEHPNLKGLGSPTTTLPLFSMVVWRSMKDLVSETLSPLLVERFRPFAGDFLRISLGDEFVDEALSLRLHPSGLRLMRRRPGWKLDPHLDPRSRFINTLLYLARPGEPEGYGTQLFRVHEENFVARWANTYYPERNGTRCEVAKTLPYRGNVALSFLNLGGGAHGAAFPVEPETAGLSRLVFQFYLEPGLDDLNALVSRLPAERQAAWTTRVKKKDLRALRRNGRA